MRAIGGFVLWVLLLSAAVAGADGEFTNMLVNPSFESGRADPSSWDGFGFGDRNWEFQGCDGERCISVSGNGMDTGWWFPRRWTPVEHDTLYRLSYWVRRDSAATNGAVLAGLNLVNRPASANREWQAREFVFRSPEWLPDLELRLGQARVNGKLYFDQVALHPAVAVHRSRGIGTLSLGSGESIVQGIYTAVHEMSTQATTDCRFLHHFSGHFDADRWILGGLDEVVYRHEVRRVGVPELPHVMKAAPTVGATISPGPGQTLTRRPIEVTQDDPRSVTSFQQRDVAVEVFVDRCDRGRLSVDVSRSGKLWRRIGEIDKPGVLKVALPPELAPAREVWVRLKSDYAGRIEVSGYRYTSMVEKSGAHHTVVGQSRYLAVLYSSPDLNAMLTDAGDLVPGGRCQAKVIVQNLGPRRKLRASIVIAQGDTVISKSEDAFPIGAGRAKRAYLPYEVAPHGKQTLRIIVSDTDTGKLLTLLEGRFTVPVLEQAGAGEVLSSDPNLAIWWCEPEHKVGDVRPAPTAEGAAVRISAAGDEYEPAQVVLTPNDWVHQCRLTVSDLLAESGSRIPASAIDVRQVQYLWVTQRTDEAGEIGSWPDPLPPHSAPVDLGPGRNHPFWITVHVPPGTPAGDYCGEIAIRADEVQKTVPLVVHVWGFDLPEDTHVRSRIGISQDLVKQYHNLESEDELRQVLGLYLESFKSHRVSPAWVGCDIGVEWKRTAERQLEPALDFSHFDEGAERALDGLGVESFALELAGIQKIENLERGTPEHEAAFGRYARALLEHLDERGWSSKACLYYPGGAEERNTLAVRREMDLIHRALPRLTRVVALSPSPRLRGAADLWCVPAHEFDPEAAEERQRAGDEVWWSLSRGALEPCLAQVIDHCGTEMRVWLWATWKHGLDGIMLREANSWDSEAAYPHSAVQNPWEDPMSWRAGPGVAAGARIPRGNGDGRLLYPPNRHAPYDSSTFLEGPVPSIRWELLRDGIEDYEYFWLLREHIGRLKESGADPASYRAAEALLQVPPEICTDAERFATAAEPIHIHRAKLAEAIEQLSAR